MAETLQVPEVEFSPEEREAAKAEATRLIASDPEVNLTCMVLMAARQLYSMARVILQRRLGEVTASAATEEILVQAMANKAEAEFTDEELRNKYTSLVPLFFQKEMARNEVQAREAEIDDAKQADAQRRGTAIPLGFSALGVSELARSKSLLLAGHPKAVQYLLDRVILTAKSAEDTVGPKTVIAHILKTLYTHTDVTKANNRDKTYVKIGINQALGSGNSLKKFDQLLANWRRLTYKNRVDLLVIDDVAQLYTAGVSGRGSGRNADSANRHVRKWADAAGCAVVAGVPLTGETKADAEFVEHIVTGHSTDVVYVWVTKQEAADLSLIHVGSVDNVLEVASELMN